MSYPDKDKRKLCWDSRDRYWECLDKLNIKDSSERPKECASFRNLFEKSCPTQWVTHFDRKRDFNVFKEKMQKEDDQSIMEDVINIIDYINIPTKELTLESIQAVITNVKKHSKNLKSHTLELILETVWQHLHTGLNKLDNQLLCSTCFFTVLLESEKQDFYLLELQKLINNEYIFKQECSSEKSPQSYVIVPLMYGMLQSAFLKQGKFSNSDNINNILEASLNLLLLMAYEYSEHTYIVFKIISAFKKVCGTASQEIIYSKKNQIKLLNLVNHNWENPITGVRDSNKLIFQTLVSVINDDILETIIQEIEDFYWNKAKYLMLAEIIGHYKSRTIANKSDITRNTHWVKGLIYSLYKPGLVSAGADMYYAILNKINSEDDWSDMFLSEIYKILADNSFKAIENYTNYWCLHTFKKFPLLIAKFIAHAKDQFNLNVELYGHLCIWKQGNKLGILEKKLSSPAHYTIIDKMISTGIEHCDTRIRISAFDIVCVLQSKSFPSQIEYQIVLNYLINNVNSDSTVLRVNMLNSFNSFLVQLQLIFMNTFKSAEVCDLQNLIEFCKNLQDFTISSLNCNGNYQRKITSIKICELIIKSLSEIPKKKQSQVKYSNKTVLEMLKENGHWLLFNKDFVIKLVSLLKDPSDDIRDHVGRLLMAHYSTELKNAELINCLIEDALSSIGSKFFYEISSGKSLFKLITSILLKEKGKDNIFNDVDDIFNFGYNELVSECKLNRDIVESIETGKQLHSFISILHVMLEICYINTYNFSLSKETLLVLLDLLNNICNQFIWECESNTSSDFSKMSDMIESIIIESGYNSNEQVDETKISGLHQIVLNCLWLNVKASCELSSILIKFSDDIEICHKCLDIITHVLETSRHKGAIEAAGTALGDAIKHLTSLANNLTKVPESLLGNKINKFILNDCGTASVTRRGAGLSIMFHKIISNDMKKGKPLFHQFMIVMLENCNYMKDIPNKLDDNERDLPKAVCIHFLTKIVIDSSLASDMMFYSGKLAELAFNNLTSPYWQIRNAALQLYGALVPKLIGQKKPSGNEEETIATVACDEFRAHSPQLWTYIVTQLNHQDYDDFNHKLQSHSNLVPILNVLANIAKRYNFSYDVDKQKSSDDNLLKDLMFLLNSPILTVRRLAAKSIFNLFSKSMIHDSMIQILSTKNVNSLALSENFLHGTLMLMETCEKYYSNVDITMFQQIMSSGVHSYLCKGCYENMIVKNEIDISDIKQTLSELDNNADAPGISVWANIRLRKFILAITWDAIPIILEILLKNRDYENHLAIILSKVENKTWSWETGLKIIMTFLKFENKFQSSVIWKILYQVSLDYTTVNRSLGDDLIKHNVDTSDLVQYLKVCELPFKQRYILPFAITICCKSIDLLNLSEITYTLTDVETKDIDMRYIAVLANNEIAKITDLPETVKITAIKTAVVLLQDEDEDIRNLSTNFYNNMALNQMTPLNPYVCLHRILDYNFLSNVFSQSKLTIESLCKDISENLFSNVVKVTDDFNPFNNDSKNIYQESEILKEIIKNLKMKCGFE